MALATLKPPRKNSVEYWSESAGVSSRVLWRLIREGELRAIKIGGRTIITPADWSAFLASRPTAGGAR